MTRSLRIEKVPATTLYCIKWNGGGEVPAMLSGNYTSQHAAKLAIAVWKSTADREEVEEESASPDEGKEKFAKRGPRPPIKSI